ncbi:GntR family transcriptional regulator, partial [Micromonospora chalcea]|uniref:aminotransferase class I/II-fold pyridoxal phosphate-dependent enzyme n=1 Tax=Micromonospora chalcea TaxID=1874 RepID=UPI0019C75F4D|nr:GntR family transcriptional regulator [Micromonospora chalcea]
AVAVEDPGWANLLDLIAALGLRTVGVPVDDDGPTVGGVRAALAAGVRALVVTSRAQNPTGAAVSTDRADALRTLLDGRADLLLIEDDHAAELARVPLHS